LNYRKKLIEVALPLDAINKASAREKSIRHGHPGALHLWWARRPLAAARAVIFAQMVDDPSTYIETLSSDKKLVRKANSLLNKRHKAWEEAVETAKMAKEAGASVPEPGPEPTLDEILAELERDRLFKIIEELVQWENTTNENVLQKARDEIWQSWRRTCAENADHPKAKELFDRHKLPAFHDPFAGGGALPLEAQRLGLESYASELNPVAVLINKAMIEIPPKFAGQPPVNPEASKDNTLFERTWKGAEGLAEDVRYYGKWMRDEAEKSIGHLYPKVEITEEMAEERLDLKQYVGQSLTVIAWLWARTVKSPNPAFAHVDVPLVSNFMLSTKKGKEAYVEPVVDGESYRFKVRVGKPENEADVKKGTKPNKGSNFLCLMSGIPIASNYIRAEAVAGNMDARLLAIVAEGQKGRVYIDPLTEHERIAKQAMPTYKPDLKVPTPCHDVDRLPMYGMPTWGDAFSPRQLVSLTTLADLVIEMRNYIYKNQGSNKLLDNGYADFLALYLAFLVDQESNQSSTFCGWNNINQQMIVTFSRQAISMVWDYAECNVFSSSTGSFLNLLERQVKGIKCLPSGPLRGVASQANAISQSISETKIISTDPPYYDNISYADLSDFFYVWLRRSLKSIFPDYFATMSVPKTEELIASVYRHKNKDKADKFFLNGMKDAIHNIAEQAHPYFPVNIFYAFKQSETKTEAKISTGWETFIEAVIQSGLSITGTWPIKTETTNKLKADVGALASSIVLVCRKRDHEAPASTRREFINNLKSELPKALVYLQRSNIAPVDLAQAAIGPGMAVYTRYSKVLDAEGNQVTVREALTLINQILDEVLAEQEGEFDSDTRWALAWFEQYGFSEGEYGVAETLSTAKNTSVAGMVDAGIVYSRGGKVRLLKPEELPEDWDPDSERRLTVWEMVHHLVRVLEKGETLAAELIAKLGGKAESARELAYRLYVICERKKWANEALAYNSLVQSWPEMETLVQEIDREEQQSLFEEG